MTPEEAAVRARRGATTRYKPMYKGVVHDPGRTVPYGGVTTACQYTSGTWLAGGACQLAASDAITTCVLCLCAKLEDRGVWPPPSR